MLDWRIIDTLISRIDHNNHEVSSSQNEQVVRTNLVRSTCMLDWRIIDTLISRIDHNNHEVSSSQNEQVVNESC